MIKTAAAKASFCSHILLVDDNKHGLVARKTVLEELGYKIATATSGEEALDLLSREKFDVVVTDYKMPRMNGAELILKIRKLDPGSRVILLSGFVEPLGLSEQNTGADVVISKSATEVGNLVRSVRRLVSGRKPPGSQRLPVKGKAKNL